MEAAIVRGLKLSFGMADGEGIAGHGSGNGTAEAKSGARLNLSSMAPAEPAYCGTLVRLATQFASAVAATISWLNGVCTTGR